MQQGKLEVPGGPEPLPGESFDYFCSRIYVAVGKAYEERKELLDVRKQVLHAIEHGAEPEQGPDYPAIAADLRGRLCRHI